MPLPHLAAQAWPQLGWQATGSACEQPHHPLCPLPHTSCLQDLGWPSVFVIYGSLGLFWNLAWQKLVADYPPLAALTKTQGAATALQQQAPVVQQQQQQQVSVAPTTVQQQQVQQQAVGRTGFPPLPRVRDLPWKEFFTNKAFLAIVMAHSAFGEQQRQVAGLQSRVISFLAAAAAAVVMSAVNSVTLPPITGKPHA